MTWQKWVLVAWLVIGALVNVALIGKPRKPLEADGVAWSLLISLGIVALVVAA